MQPQSAVLKPQIGTNYWLQLPVTVRAEMRKVFNIPRSSGGTVVSAISNGKATQVQTSDGTTPQDLAVLTVEKMQIYLGSEEKDIHKLFQDCALKVNESLIVVPKKFEHPVEAAEVNHVVPVVESPKKRGRPSLKLRKM